MEFQEVVRRRRMVRSYDGRPVDADVVERALDNATRAPSAGFTQGWAFVVLDTPDDVLRFWRAASPDAGPGGSPDAWLRGMMTAPVLVVPCSSRAAYLARYAEPDKGWEDPAHDGTDEGAEARWPVPFWHMDAAMASLLLLQTAVDAGLGGCFAGIPPERVGQVRAELGVPADHDPIGVVTLGHPAPGGAAGSPARRRRRPLADVVHRGGWTTSGA